MAARNPYDILGLSTTASQEEVKKAYKTLALRYHPDKNGNSPEANERFKEVSDAYQILGDEQRRRMFDSQGHGFAADPFFSSEFHSSFGRGAFHDPFELFRSFFGNHDPFQHQVHNHFSSTPFNDPFFRELPSTSRMMDGSMGMMGGRIGMMDPFSSFPPSFPAGVRGGFSSTSSQTTIRNGVRETITTVTQNGETRVTKEKYDATGKLISSETTGGSDRSIKN